MIKIPEESLKEYLKVNLFREYDLTVKGREEHDSLAEFGRTHRCPNCSVPLTLNEYEIDAGLCSTCSTMLLDKDD